MHLKFLKTAVVLLAALPVLARAELPSLTVHVTGAEPATGIVEVSVFDSAETFFKKPYLQQSGKVSEDGTWATRFAALPEGDYALIVVHDANENNKLDSGFLGFGGERYGYSNDAGNPLFGRTRFEDARITISEPTEIEISLD